MKITRFIILSLLLCLMFQGSANAENTEKADPLGDAIIAYAAKDFKKAVELLEPLAENNVRAKALLAQLIFKGMGVDKDTNKGLAMIMDAARQGDEEARKKAAEYNHTLASTGDEKAMYNMGYMCLNGWGEKVEPDQCLRWLEKAVEMGHPRSAKFLAYIYKNGKYGVTADQSKADYWTQKSQQ